uniref:Transmembrane protein 144 n=1 Tax=Ascaris lumbricoides TaxID=6252 RepID=A0A9J2PDH0_ASCLU
MSLSERSSAYGLTFFPNLKPPKVVLLQVSCVKSRCSLTTSLPHQKLDLVMEQEGNYALGLVATFLSVLLFGTVFIPVRHYATGDGMFVQFMMGIGIIVVGFVIFITEGFPKIYPLAMLGGVVWTIGNSFAIALFNEIGMALSILIWNSTSCVVGWATARFGLFGLKPAPPKSDILNYIGLAFVITGGFIYFFVRSTVSNREKPQMEVFDQNKLVIHIVDHREDFDNAPQRGLVYVFSHYIGILMTATSIFLVYAVLKRNKPFVTPQLALPAALTGAFWGAAMAFLFIANENISQTIAFPLITTVPGCIVSLWSVFYFKEITGKRNLIILAIAFTQTMLGAVFIAASKEIEL